MNVIKRMLFVCIDYYLIIIMSQMFFLAKIIHKINENCPGPLILKVNLMIEESKIVGCTNPECRNEESVVGSTGR